MLMIGCRLSMEELKQMFQLKNKNKNEINIENEIQ